ncbi:MAG: hypothetical protein Q7S36_01760 [Candidatus Liptonbacteria bacterium]|nr:hypothetical protein [Candidatus Liptonbacteria bacterium]
MKRFSVLFGIALLAIAGIACAEAQNTAVVLKENFIRRGYNLFFVSVDYDQSVEGLVVKGNYDWNFYDWITRDGKTPSPDFPAAGSGKARVKVYLIHFGRKMSGKDVLGELDRMGYKPADIHTLLSLGAKRSELQRKFPIAGLGSAWSPSGMRSLELVPCLVGNKRTRGVDLRWRWNEWDAITRFAAVRK